MALTENLVAYWKLDESSGDASDSTWSWYTLTNSSATYTTWKINNWASFSGSTQFLYNNSLDCNIATRRSMSFWIKTTKKNQFVLWDRNIIPNPDEVRLIYINSSWYIDYWRYQWSDQNITYSTYICDWNRHHIVITEDWTSWWELYVDWTSIWTNATVMTWTNLSNVFNLWKTWNTTTTVVWYFTWMLDEVGIRDSVLTSDEITELYNSWDWNSYPFSIGSAIKTLWGLAKASVKTVNGLAIASVKSIAWLQ